MVNTPLLHQVLEYITDHPQNWDQTRWSSCFAGWTLRLGAGAELRVNAECDCHGSICADLVLEGQTLAPWEVQEKAAKLLGLDGEQSLELFNIANTLADLSILVDQYTPEPVNG